MVQKSKQPNDRKNKQTKTVKKRNEIFITDKTFHSNINKHFSTIKDPRIDRTKQHLLMDIIGLTICAVISGCNTWVEIELFGKSKHEWLKKYLHLSNGIPSHDTIGRVFAAINPQAFETCFMSWMKTIIEDATDVIAIDGKSVCGSAQHGLGKKAIHMVSAFSCEHSLVLGQIKTDEKSNEITAIPKLLNLLDLKGSIITIDAMGCQKAIAKQIVTGGGDYVFGLKGNQGNLHKEVQKIFKEATAKNFESYNYSYYETKEKGHGREEIRRYWTIEQRPIAADICIFFGKEPWKGLSVIGMVESERKVGDKKTKEKRYYISSIENNAEKFAYAVRGHWGIENNLHWMLDVAFREDYSQVRIKNAAENFSIIRRIALNMLKNEKTFKGSINSKRLKAGWDSDYLIKILCS